MAQDIIDVTWDSHPVTNQKETQNFGLLDESVIDKYVPDNHQPGNYRIGRLIGNSFRIIYVGRVDKRKDRGIKDRLKEHIGEWPGNLYFNWNDASTIEEAYNNECKDYHTWLNYEGTLENDNHPAKPEGKTNLKCPVCNQ